MWRDGATARPLLRHGRPTFPGGFYSSVLRLHCSISSPAASELHLRTPFYKYFRSLEELMDGWTLPWLHCISTVSVSSTTGQQPHQTLWESCPHISDHNSCNCATAMHIRELDSCVFMSHCAECLLHILTCYCHHFSRAVPAPYEAFFLWGGCQTLHWQCIKRGWFLAMKCPNLGVALMSAVSLCLAFIE